jgi:TDG/mug DNA glycosylase family protein
VDELRAGATALATLAQRFSPTVIAVVGLTAWRTAYSRPKARVGLQPEMVGGCKSWVLPNPSGLNAHYQLADLIRLFSELRTATK